MRRNGLRDKRNAFRGIRYWEQKSGNAAQDFQELRGNGPTNRIPTKSSLSLVAGIGVKKKKKRGKPQRTHGGAQTGESKKGV